METTTIKLKIEGMHCAACSASSERALMHVEGVDFATVNLVTEKATVSGRNLDIHALIKAIEDIGFKAFPEDEEREEKEQKTNKTVLIVMLVLAFLELYVGMSHMVPFLPLPRAISMEGNPLGHAIVQLVLTLPIMILCWRIYVNGFKSLIHKAPTMDALVAIGTITAFIYSVVNTIMAAMGVQHVTLYYESAAVVLALISLGKYLESQSVKSAKREITSLVQMMPRTAYILDGEAIVEVDAKDIKVGDTLVINPGLRIAADGVILSGTASIDESMLTGESLPVTKGPGNPVSGGTICKEGVIRVKATGVGKDTAISRIIKLVNDAQDRKAPVSKLADKISGIFVPAVIIIALVVLVIWLIAREPTVAVNAFVAVLVVACPCALGLATPIGVVVAMGRGAAVGVLFRGGDVIEQTSHVDTVVFDKTGTLTKGNLHVEEAIASTQFTYTEFLKIAASCEYGSEHPIAEAIIHYATLMDADPEPPIEVRTFPGRGVAARLAEYDAAVGTREFIESLGILIPDAPDSRAGATRVFVVKNKTCCGYIDLSDETKPDAKRTVSLLKGIGLKTVMITGDAESAAKKVAQQTGIDDIKWRVLPENKAKEVTALKEAGRVVAMVGDGINDAPALSEADVGMAMKTGTDVAADASGIVLMRSDLTTVYDAVALSRKTMRIIKQNLFWAFFYNTVLIPIAGGILVPFFGIQFSPAFAGLAMACSSVSVVLNSLRLRRFQAVEVKQRVQPDSVATVEAAAPAAPAPADEPQIDDTP